MGAREGDSTSSDPRVRLRAWQVRLEGHFAQLADARQKTGWPVFALEHGLSASERAALMRDIRECAATSLDEDVSLPWVVYAAEIGYEYSGYEYWQTFAQKTPALDKRQFTHISRLFARFAGTYHGALPNGPWAEWFRHIAWPITHGILPRDLQRQLAELLSDASQTFRAETFSSFEALGNHLRARSFDYSSRFRQFAENETLLGQIALALLLQDTSDTRGGAVGAILHTDTLARIVEDLNREQDTRQWLSDARSTAARFRLRGLSRITLRGGSTESAFPGERAGGSPDNANRLPRPALLLREEAPDRWQVRVELPNLAHWVARSPQWRDVLMRKQGRVAGVTVPILAKGGILRDVTTTRILATWPSPETQLLSFEDASPELNAALRVGFRLDAGTEWLFSIGSDGQARQLATRVLRAGASYLLLQKEEIRNPAPGLRALQITCSGIYGLRIDVPREVPDALVDVLSILKLEVAQTLEVWPAGLPVAEWSGDGHAVLVAGQPFVLGIGADHRLTRLSVSIDGVHQPDVHAEADSRPGDPLFVELPSLRPGPHRISISARTTDDEAGSDSASEGVIAPSRLEGELSCIVREPRTAAAGQAGALSFAVLPSAPSLEDVWEDRIEIHAAVPGATSIRGLLVLRGPAGQELLKRHFSLPSPLSTDGWRREFAAVRKAAESKYDDAQACMLEFDAGALGRGRVTAERDFTSLRWAIRANGHEAVLIDSQGCSDLAVSTFPCTAPSLEQRGDPATALDRINIDGGGELLVARSGRFEAAIVVVPPQHVNSMAALSGAPPQVPIPARTSAAIVSLAQTAALWERARLAGSSFAEMRRASAVQLMVGRIMSVVAGGRWADAEAVLRERGPQATVDTMRGIIAGRADERAVGVLLAKGVASALGASIVEAEEVLRAALAPFVHMDDLTALSAYALRLAASPAQAHSLVEGWVNKDGSPDARERALVDGLLERPVVLRAARYFVIATHALANDRGRDLRAITWGN